jgi:monofunctional glycosyltransferase
MAAARRGNFRRRVVLRLLAVMIVLGLLPVALALIYGAEFVRPVSTPMIWRAISGQPVSREWVDFDDVAPIMRFSVLMSEDGQFCGHRGVDWAELNAVIDDVLDGEKTRGASTLTMQTAKNLFLWPSRSYFRKALEIPLAIFLDVAWSKRRIMEVYLNIAQWDEGIYGVETAAGHYFSVSAAQLDARQAALLTSALPNPVSRNPARPSAGLQRIANVIERRAAQSGGYVSCVR